MENEHDKIDYQLWSDFLDFIKKQGLKPPNKGGKEVNLWLDPKAVRTNGKLDRKNLNL